VRLMIPSLCTSVNHSRVVSLGQSRANSPSSSSFHISGRPKNLRILLPVSFAFRSTHSLLFRGEHDKASGRNVQVATQKLQLGCQER
jgi:hypothetical protein